MKYFSLILENCISRESQWGFPKTLCLYHKPGWTTHMIFALFVASLRKTNACLKSHFLTNFNETW